MVQKVRYNGGTQRMYECSDPTDLIVGKEYEVIEYQSRLTLPCVSLHLVRWRKIPG